MCCAVLSFPIAASWARALLPPGPSSVSKSKSKEQKPPGSLGVPARCGLAFRKLPHPSHVFAELPETQVHSGHLQVDPRWIPCSFEARRVVTRRWSTFFMLIPSTTSSHTSSAGVQRSVTAEGRLCILATGNFLSAILRAVFIVSTMPWERRSSGRASQTRMRFGGPPDSKEPASKMSCAGRCLQKSSLYDPSTDKRPVAWKAFHRGTPSSPSPSSSFGCSPTSSNTGGHAPNIAQRWGNI
mmetsp:Transcript_32178/g.68694  ORF Transcript_32178/g.68694 Transcript_32178/m.68694 type:complete len:241 (+) Transcript_32178:691-1413(+)